MAIFSLMLHVIVQRMSIEVLTDVLIYVLNDDMQLLLSFSQFHISQPEQLYFAMHIHFTYMK